MATFPAGTVAYSYIRMSTQRQLRGDSLTRQTQMSDAFIQKHGLILDKTLHDIGQSAWTGANLKKGALGKFLALVEEGTIAPGSVLLVEAVDFH
jgi:DNA invertase Pin-like site-specific DNA recombinase